MENKVLGNELYLSLYKEIRGLSREGDTDLMINEDGSVWCTSTDGKCEKRAEDFPCEKIKTLGSLLASYYNNALNTQKPFFDCDVPLDHARLHINIPPSSDRPTLSLRFPSQNYRDLDNLEKNGMITEEQKKTLIRYVLEKKNIIINGETGSGKTTLLSALINKIPPSERIVTIEDTKEISCSLPNITRLYTINRVVYDDMQAVRDSLRMNPSRIIYGEVRDGRATLELIKAWNTGHKGGMCTIHANVRESDYIGGVRTRLLSLTNEVSSSPQTEAIDEVLEVIVQIEIKNGKRRVVSIENVKG